MAVADANVAVARLLPSCPPCGNWILTIPLHLVALVVPPLEIEAAGGGGAGVAAPRAWFAALPLKLA